MSDDQPNRPEGAWDGTPQQDSETLWTADDASLPPRPQLECAECEYGNDQPDQLALHMMQVHAYSEAQAWYLAGQENERLYPRYRAPEGTFTVMSIDYDHSQGKLVSRCNSLEEAVQLAHRIAGLYPSILVYDDAGNEVYSSGPTPAPNLKAD